MRERPILFSAPMVRAILEGRKTQTRRVVKPQPFSNGMKYSAELGDILCHDDYLPPSAMLLRAGSKRHQYNATQDEWGRLCPCGQPGDRLWGRETGMLGRDSADVPIMWTFGTLNDAEYKMHPDAPEGSAQWCLMWKKKPSIYMPRWASRITLEVTEVRVERLHDISEEDARAEGVERNHPTDETEGWLDYLDMTQGGEGFPVETARDSFRTLWDSINGSDAWDLNPWVWAVSFKRVQP
jgi:hypothetical protein